MNKINILKIQLPFCFLYLSKDGYDMKYSVRPLNESLVADSIFETFNILEALEKVQREYNESNTRCIIVSCPEDLIK
jgi:hypothetical protein